MSGTKGQHSVVSEGFPTIRPDSEYLPTLFVGGSVVAPG
jgi:hypothetical protein